MTARLNYYQASPEAVAPLVALEKYLSSTGLDPVLLEIVKLRASQINGCAYCVDMHLRKLRELGEDDQRMGMITVWWEATCFSGRERAALAWTEAVTLVAETRVPDAVYEQARGEFDERELVDLTMAVVAINSWNRLAVSFRAVPGTPAR